MRARLTVWFIALVVCVIDQATKWWAIRDLSDGHVVPIIGSHLSLKLVRNEGAALSIFGGYGILITVFMIIVLVVLIGLHGRATGFFGFAVFGMAVGGAIGNLIDRFFRGDGWGRGPVIDMIDYGGFFIGNVADIAIVCAAAVTIAVTWTGVPILKPRVNSDEGAIEEDASA